MTLFRASFSFVFAVLTGLLLRLKPGCASDSTNCSAFSAMSECICLGQTLSYHCTISGGTSTVWGGSAFHCISGSILLRHSQYPHSATGICNNGLITGRSLTVNGECYTSQLDVSVSSSLNGQTVQCASNNGQIVGTNNISITEDPYPPPNDVRLTEVHPGYLAFTWSLIPLNCESLYYNIIARNCGIMCPSSTTHGTITCTGAVIRDTSCIFSFAVQTVVCENMVGNSSSPVSVILRGPSSPTIQCEPQYSADTGILKSITTVFEEVDSFTISVGIEEIVSSYTITYMDSKDGTICGYITVQTLTSCTRGICKHTFKLSTSSCLSIYNVNVTVFGTNQLGNGSASAPVTVEFINRYFGVEFNLLRSNVLCIFREKQSKSEKFCGITLSPQDEDICSTDSLFMTESRQITSSFMITVDLPEFPSSQNNIFCYVITASNGTVTAKIEGTFNAGCNQEQLSDGTALPNNVSCGAPLHSLGIKNGIVCYSGIDSGAVAVYSCFGCTTGATVLGPSARTCKNNGSWNGTIPRCECGPDHTRVSDLDAVHDGKDINKLILPASIGMMGFVLIAVVIISATVIVILLRAKSKVQEELRQSQASALYDEIGMPPSIIDSMKNVAYVSTIKKTQTSTS